MPKFAPKSTDGVEMTRVGAGHWRAVDGSCDRFWFHLRNVVDVEPADPKRMKLTVYGTGQTPLGVEFVDRVRWTTEDRWVIVREAVAKLADAPAAGRSAAPQKARGVVAKSDDFGTMTITELLARAVPLGYEEKPGGNAGIRAMRVRNWLRAHAK